MGRGRCWMLLLVTDENGRIKQLRWLASQHEGDDGGTGRRLVEHERQ